MTPKQVAKARRMIARHGYARRRIRKIRRQWGYWDQMLIENLETNAEECLRQMERLLKKVNWYSEKYLYV